MRTWKIAVVVGLAILVVGLVTASAYAAVIRPTATPYGAYNGVSSPYGGYASGMMRGGMMGGYGSYPYNSYGVGGYGCGNCFGCP